MRIPREATEREALLRDRPDGWEYLLYAGVLASGMEAHEDAYRDHLLRQARAEGPALDEMAALGRLETALADLLMPIESVLNLFDLHVQQRAFGPPGQHGDAALVEHLADRTVDGYVDLLGWGRTLRATRVPPEWREVYGLTADLARQPVENLRGYVERVVATVAHEVDGRAESQQHPRQVEVTLVLTVDEELAEACATRIEQHRKRLATSPGSFTEEAGAGPGRRHPRAAGAPSRGGAGGFLPGALFGGVLASWFHRRASEGENLSAGWGDGSAEVDDTADHEADGLDVDWM